jgi:LysM repeat protein
VLVGEAEAALKAGRLVEARTKWLQVLERPVADALRQKVEEQLGAVNTRLVLTSAGMPEKTEYVVSVGDSLDKLAKRYKTTIDLLQKSSNTQDPSLIKLGDRLRILEGSFAVEVSRSKHDLLVLFNGKFFKRYAVGIGKEGKTPVGSFEVAERIKEPVWWRADGKAIPFGNPENILGTRWMSIRATGDTPYIKGYGIHGTWDDASVGRSESAGCVRMRNADVEELYILIPVGTPVTIRE